MRSVVLLLFSISSLWAQPRSYQPAGLEVYFSPQEQTALHLIEQIDKQSQAILVAIYAFTDRDIGDALVRAKQRGVTVEVIIDPFSVKRGSAVTKLVRGGIPVFVWDPPHVSKKRRRGIMHNKFCVFGNEAVWTGSFNFTYDAVSRNQENALLIQDPALAGRYQRQFQSIKLSGCRPYAEYMALHPKKVSTKPARLKCTKR